MDAGRFPHSVHLAVTVIRSPRRSSLCASRFQDMGLYHASFDNQLGDKSRGTASLNEVSMASSMKWHHCTTDTAIGAMRRLLVNGAVDGVGWVPRRQRRLLTTTTTAATATRSLVESTASMAPERSATSDEAWFLVTFWCPRSKLPRMSPVRQFPGS